MAQPAQTHDVTVENSHFVHRGADGNFRLRPGLGYLWDALDSFAEEISTEDWQQYACVSLDRDMGRIGSNLAP